MATKVTNKNMKKSYFWGEGKSTLFWVSLATGSGLTYGALKNGDVGFGLVMAAIGLAGVITALRMPNKLRLEEK